jgi:two-component system, chemotaxis family, protein-glutamate methylesterase/glutaminase
MPSRSFEKTELFVIGASAGGIDMLNRILPHFEKCGQFSVVVVIHLPPEGPNLLTSLFEPVCKLNASEAIPGEPLKRDHIYFAPSDYHLCLEPNHTLSLSSEEPLNFSRPSIDILFESAAFAFGHKACGILLTGANNDGALGLKKIQEAGGIAIVQEPKDAEYDTMPLSAMEIMRPDYIMNKVELSELIKNLCSRGKDE